MEKKTDQPTRNYILEGNHIVDDSGLGAPRRYGFGYDKRLGRWKTPFPSCARRKAGKSLTDEDKDTLKRLHEYRKARYDSSFAEESFIFYDKILRPYQGAGLEYIILGDDIILADEMGLGKTIMAIYYLNYIQDKPYKALVICPASLKINWLKECNRFLYKKTKITIINPKDEIKTAEPGIYIINYDIITRFPIFLKNKFDVLILDEAHYVKNKKARRTKIVLGETPNGGIKADKRIAITGTPLENRPLEFYTILNTFMPYGFPNRMFFERRYCNGRVTKFGWDNKGHSNLEELARKVRSTVMIRRLKKDVAKDIPAKTRKLVFLDLSLSKKQKKLAEMSYKDIQTALKPGSANGVHIMQARRELGEMKVKPALGYIEDVLESENKLVIFAHHKDVISSLLKGLEHYKPLVISGKTPPNKRQGIVDTFQNDPKRRVFIGNILAAGVGLTMTAASNVIFVEYDFKPGVNRQAEDRLHRIGQTNPVFSHFLVVNNSLDSKLLLSINEKEKVLDTVLGGFKEE